MIPTGMPTRSHTKTPPTARRRRRQPVQDLGLDRDVVLVAVAEVGRLEARVGVERDELGQVDPVLLEERLVQAERVPDGRPQLGVALRPARRDTGSADGSLLKIRTSGS